MSTDPQKIGRYEVEHAVGRGSMGVVYLAMDPLLKRSVAVKIMREKSGNADETIQRFKREAEISAKLNHPNIITIYDVGVDPEMGPFLTMEFVVGASLAHILKMDLPAFEIMKLLLQAMAALQAAQLAGIVHRDVKPENMLVSQTGQLKLMDFGLARGDQSRLTAEGMLFGTPSYTAPELLTGSDPSPSTDRYAFYVTAFEALTGALPYRGSSVGSTLYRIVHEPPTIPPTLDPAMQAVFMKALAKEPSERHPDLPAFMEALICAAPLDPEMKSKLLDNLDLANTSTSSYIFPPITSENLPAFSDMGSGYQAVVKTSRTDPKASESHPGPPTYPLHMRSTPDSTLEMGPENVPEARSASTAALTGMGQDPLNAETVSSPPPMAVGAQENMNPFLQDSATVPALSEVKLGSSGKEVKNGHGLRWAIAAFLVLGGIGLLGGYFSGTPRKTTRTIAVLSEPEGASVYVDGQKLGETPLAPAVIDGDATAIRVKLAGYLSQSYRIKEGEKSVKLVLKRPPHIISVITVPPGAQVFLNDEAVGLTPIQNLGIPAQGSSKLKITHEDFTPWEAEVDATFPFPDLIRLAPLPKARK